MPKAIGKQAVARIIAERTENTVGAIAQVLDAQAEVVAGLLRQEPAGTRITVIPGGLVVYVAETPARKARIGKHPITGEDIRIKAKKAGYKVKASVRKGLKEVI